MITRASGCWTSGGECPCCSCTPAFLDPACTQVWGGGEVLLRLSLLECASRYSICRHMSWEGSSPERVAIQETAGFLLLVLVLLLFLFFSTDFPAAIPPWTMSPPCVEFCRNRIAGVGGAALAGLIVRGSPLEVVDLDSNCIGDEGARAWDVAVKKSTSLQSYVDKLLVCAL